MKQEEGFTWKMERVDYWIETLSDPGVGQHYLVAVSATEVANLLKGMKKALLALREEGQQELRW